MIGFAFGIVLGAIAAVFVWLHMHHKNALRAVEDNLTRDVTDSWRDLRELEQRLVTKIENTSSHDAK
jgi:hypothetical protein